MSSASWGRRSGTEAMRMESRGVAWFMGFLVGKLARVLPWEFSHFVRLKAILGVFDGIFLGFQSA